MAQSQYAEKSDFTSLAVTPAAAARFSDPVIEAQLQAASSIADSYIVSQFTLPLTEWDMSLTTAVCNIAAYRCYSQYGFNPNVGNVDEWIVKRYEDAIAWLVQIRDKQIFPQWTDSGTVPTGTDEGGAWVISDPPKGFTDRGINIASNWTPDAGE